MDLEFQRIERYGKEQEYIYIQSKSTELTWALFEILFPDTGIDISNEENAWILAWEDMVLFLSFPDQI